MRMIMLFLFLMKDLRSSLEGIRESYPTKYEVDNGSINLIQFSSRVGYHTVDGCRGGTIGDSRVEYGVCGVQVIRMWNLGRWMLFSLHDRIWIL